MRFDKYRAVGILLVQLKGKNKQAPLGEPFPFPMYREEQIPGRQV